MPAASRNKDAARLLLRRVSFDDRTFPPEMLACEAHYSPRREVLRSRPGRQARPTLPTSLSARSAPRPSISIRSTPRIACRPHGHRTPGRSARPVPLPGRGQPLAGGVAPLLQLQLQACLDLLVAGQHLGLVDVVQLERLGQGEKCAPPDNCRPAPGTPSQRTPGTAGHGGKPGRLGRAPRHDRPDDGQTRHTVMSVRT